MQRNAGHSVARNVEALVVQWCRHIRGGTMLVQDEEGRIKVVETDGAETMVRDVSTELAEKK